MTHNSGVSASTCRSRTLPLMLSVAMSVSSQGLALTANLLALAANFVGVARMRYGFAAAGKALPIFRLLQNHSASGGVCQRLPQCGATMIRRHTRARNRPTDLHVLGL